MTDRTTDAAEGLLIVMGGLFIMFCVTPLGVIFDGFVMAQLWNWFAVPLLRAPSIPLAGAIGLSVLAGLLSHQWLPTPEGKLPDRFAFMFFHPAMALLIGWIAHFFLNA